MEDRVEDRNRRRPERTNDCWPEGSKKEEVGDSSFFRSRRWKMGGVIEHKSCPTGRISQQQNQNQNRPVQRRADCAPLDALGARRKTRRVRVARRTGCAPEDAPGARRTTRRLRAATRRLRAARRAACAPQDAPVARRKTRRERAAKRTGCTPRACMGPSVLFPGSGRNLEVVGRRSRRVADGTASPGRLGRGASPSPLAATGSSTQHLSQSRGARSCGAPCFVLRPSVCGDVF